MRCSRDVRPEHADPSRPHAGTRSRKCDVQNCPPVRQSGAEVSILLSFSAWSIGFPLDPSLMNTWALVNPRTRRNARASARRSRQASCPDHLEESHGLVGPRKPPTLRRARSKNCANAKKRTTRSKKWRQHELQALESSQLQEQIRHLDRRLTLMNARALVHRANSQAAALDVMARYYRCMSRGYDPGRAPEQARATARFLHSAFVADLRTPDFTGLNNLMQQWELLSVYHASVSCSISGVEIVANEERPGLQLGERREERGVFVVKTYGVTTLEISRATFEGVFPHILSNEPLVQSLIGKTYSFAFTLFAYVSAQDGRVFQLESKIDLTSALLDLLKDPFVTLETVNSTTMNKRGNLLLRADVLEDQNDIENGFL